MVSLTSFVKVVQPASLLTDTALGDMVCFVDRFDSGPILWIGLMSVWTEMRGGFQNRVIDHKVVVRETVEFRLIVISCDSNTP